MAVPCQLNGAPRNDVGSGNGGNMAEYHAGAPCFNPHRQVPPLYLMAAAYV